MATLAAGELLGPFRLIEPLGRGGMASVWKAHEAALDRHVALKVLPPEFLHEETFAARFQREAKVIARLEHPNIVPIFAFGITEGIPWMAMRLVGGGSLSQALKKGRLPRERAVRIVRAVAEALTYAHAGGVVHRDVKPQNILLDEQGRVYLADFGIARMVEGGAAITRTGLVSGTPQYMSPEQATGHSLDHRVDIYALGIVTYELFTGRTPFSADTPVAVLMKQVSSPIPVPAKDLVPEALLGPLMKSLAKNPEERWQTASEFADAIERGMSLAPTAVATAVPPLPPVGTSPSFPPATTSASRPGASLTTVAVVAGLGFFAVLAVVALVLLWPKGSVETAGSPLGPPVSGPAVTVAAAGQAPPISDMTQPATLAPPSPEARPAAPPIPLARAARATSETRPAEVAPPTSTVPQTTTPALEVPPPTTAAAVARPVGTPFRLNEKIGMGATVGPVALRQARFVLGKGDELEIQVEFHCGDGKDQLVTYEVALLDEAGGVLQAVKEKKSLEENETKTFKPKRRLPPGQVDAIRSFRVTFTSEPD